MYNSSKVKKYNYLVPQYLSFYHNNQIGGKPKSKSLSTKSITSTPVLLNKSFDLKNLAVFQKKYSKKRHNKILQNAISKNPTHEILLDHENTKHITHSFKKRIKLKTKITDQLVSGRCWIFSFLNMMRYQIIKDYQLPLNFELSQSYLSFYDKLEKSYYFLQKIVETKNYQTNDRLIEWLFKNYFNEGGNWNMLVNLISKYGIVPKSVMPETYQSSHSRSLDTFLYQNLLRISSNIRNNRTGSNLQKYLNKQMYFIYRLLVIFLGHPPTSFTWEYVDTKNKHHQIDNLTPLKFSNNYIKFNPEEWITCGNFPLKQYPYYNKYNIKYCNNMIDGQETNILNIPISEIELLMKDSLDDDIPVWAAVDWDKYYSCEYSILDPNIYDYRSIGHRDVNKTISLEYNVSKPNHAVLIIGYNTNDKGSIDRWLIENSHGRDRCKSAKNFRANRMGKGYVTMTTTWLKQYLYQIVIKSKYLKKQLLTKITKKPIVVNPWDPLGCELLMTN